MEIARAQPKTRRLSLWVWLLVAAISIVAAILIPFFMPIAWPGIAEVRLPNGSILTLQAATYGTHHELELPITKLKRFPLSLWKTSNIPDKLARDTETDNIVLWFTLRDAETDKPLSFQWWKRSKATDSNGWSVFDDHGECEYFEEGFSSYSNGHRRTSGKRKFDREEGDIIVASSALPVFRCDEETFKLQLFNQKDQIVAEMDVPWHGPKSFPTWTPDPLPASKNIGKLTVTLKSVSGRAGHFWNDYDWNIDIDPEITITSDGGPAAWHVDHYLLADPMGNTYRYGDRCELSLKETAWKLSARIYRNEDAPLPSEVWKTGDLKIGKRNIYTPVKKRHSVNGADVEIVAIGGAGSTRHEESIPSHPGSYNSSRSFLININAAEPSLPCSIEHETNGPKKITKVKSEAAYIIFSTTMLKPLQQFRIRGEDDRGRQVLGQLEEFEGKSYWFFLPPTDATSIDLQVVVTDPKEVDFLIVPPTPE